MACVNLSQFMFSCCYHNWLHIVCGLNDLEWYLNWVTTLKHSAALNVNMKCIFDGLLDSFWKWCADEILISLITFSPGNTRIYQLQRWYTTKINKSVVILLPFWFWRIYIIFLLEAKCFSAHTESYSFYFVVSWAPVPVPGFLRKGFTVQSNLTRN